MRGNTIAPPTMSTVATAIRTVRRLKRSLELSGCIAIERKIILDGTMPLDPIEIRRALRHLRTADPEMGGVIRKAGPFRLKIGRSRFHMLVASIISQQISGKAAASIRRKLEQYIAPQKISPQSLARLSREELRGVGLSTQKALRLVTPHGSIVPDSAAKSFAVRCIAPVSGESRPPPCPKSVGK